jgi:hypothetical protein
MSEQKNFVNLVHGISNTRVYKIKREIFCYTATQKEIQAYSTTSVQEMAIYLLEKTNDENCSLDLMFGYCLGSLSKMKMKKLNLLLKQGATDVNVETISRWVSLLL